MNTDILFGKTTEHLVPLEGTLVFVHRQMLNDFLKLQKDARGEGFDLQVISGFRDYERQLKIWNSKASGERPLFDDQERPLIFAELSPKEIMFSILRWSALPGCSRHHWGTDIDVFDGRTQSKESVRLMPAETVGDGLAAPLHAWLDHKIEAQEAYGFYRPYETDRGGVSPEKWHLSYSPLSLKYLDSYTPSLFRKNIENEKMTLNRVILEHADEIYQRFFLNIDLP